MSVHSAGWAVEVTGARPDLDDLQRALPAPFDPWVEDDETSGGTKLLLRSKSWFQLEDVDVVHEQAVRLLEQIRGALLLLFGDDEPLSLGSVVRFDYAGGRNVYVMARSAVAFGAAGRFRPVVAVAEPTETQLQKWLKAAEADDMRAEFFVHLSRADNWFDIYKAAELLRKLAGGHHALEIALGNGWPQFERVWLTANFHRHAPGCAPPLPRSPPTLAEARRVLQDLAAKFL